MYEAVNKVENRDLKKRLIGEFLVLISSIKEKRGESLDELENARFSQDEIDLALDFLASKIDADLNKANIQEFEKVDSLISTVQVIL